jgi:hypothetical protein
MRLVMSSPSTSPSRASMSSTAVNASPKTLALASPSSSSRACLSDSSAPTLTIVSIAASERITRPSAPTVAMRSTSQLPSPPPRWVLMSL